ncbi:hypothetical protein SAMN04488577_3316 [Bacillus sp. cl95]|nr:hypothetical protein SAMN02799634_104197 [Bacillus sp. UNCCL13]SFQ88785.1 hypothetical protein SAMN04488577_3316 [Bacillus sp. cl95]
MSEMDRKQKIIFFTVLIVIVGSIYFLYQMQLGAIPFFLLAILFSILAYKQAKKNAEPKRQKGNE